MSDQHIFDPSKIYAAFSAGYADRHFAVESVVEWIDIAQEIVAEVSTDLSTDGSSVFTDLRCNAGKRPAES